MAGFRGSIVHNVLYCVISVKLPVKCDFLCVQYYSILQHGKMFSLPQIVLTDSEGCSVIQLTHFQALMIVRFLVIYLHHLIVFAFSPSNDLDTSMLIWIMKCYRIVVILMSITNRGRVRTTFLTFHSIICKPLH